MISKKKKVFTKIAGVDFSAEIGNSGGFSGREQVISKKKGLHPKNVMKSRVSPQKTPIWASICTPVALSMLISWWHSSRLGGHGPGMPPHGARSDWILVSSRIPLTDLIVMRATYYSCRIYTIKVPVIC